MNSINNASFSPNFTGIKFDVSKVTKDKQRWENIAKIVEQRTAKVKSEDLVQVHSLNKGKGIYIDVETFAKTDKGGEYQIEATGDKFVNMMKRPDRYIAGKIIKFINVCRKQDKTYNALGDFLSKIKNKDEDFAQKITDIVVDKIVNEQKAIVSNDKFLSSINCYL